MSLNGIKVDQENVKATRELAKTKDDNKSPKLSWSSNILRSFCKYYEENTCISIYSSWIDYIGIYRYMRGVNLENK